MHVTCARIGTRVYLRRLGNILAPPQKGSLILIVYGMANSIGETTTPVSGTLVNCCWHVGAVDYEDGTA
jgi:hypothetical protein